MDFADWFQVREKTPFVPGYLCRSLKVKSVELWLENISS